MNEIFSCTKGLHENIGVIFFRADSYIMMLWKILSESLVSISNKDNYKTFTKGPPASLSHFIQNILKHSSGKCTDLTMAALSFTK